MGFSYLPDKRSMNAPDGTLNAAGTGILKPAADPGSAAAPRLRFIQIFQRVLSMKGKK
jgi:hypothetical protein